MLTAQQHLAIIKNQYPTIDEKTIQTFDNGWDYIVYVVNNQHAFRFPRADNYEHKLPIQVTFLEEFAKQSPVAVPHLTLYHHNQQQYVTYDFIPGEPFTVTLFEKFTAEERLRIAQQLAQFLMALHAFPLDKARALQVQEIDPLPFWRQWLEKTREKVYQHIDKDAQAWIETLFKNFFTLLEKHPFAKTFTHSDIMPEHILIDPDTHQLAGIIDFGDITIGDPAYDFTTLRTYGDQFLADVYKSYQLPLDKYTDQRRQFYAHRLPISELAHSLKLQQEEKIVTNTQILYDYITMHPHITQQ